MFDQLETKTALLRSALGAAVPLYVVEYKHRSWDELIAIAHESSQIVAEKGDIIMFRSKKKGETAAAFNALARGVAILSFCPGGVKFLGDHYQNVGPGFDEEAVAKLSQMRLFDDDAI